MPGERRRGTCWIWTRERGDCSRFMQCLRREEKAWKRRDERNKFGRKD